MQPSTFEEGPTEFSGIYFKINKHIANRHFYLYNREQIFCKYIVHISGNLFKKCQELATRPLKVYYFCHNIIKYQLGLVKCAFMMPIKLLDNHKYNSLDSKNFDFSI